MKNKANSKPAPRILPITYKMTFKPGYKTTGNIWYSGGEGQINHIDSCTAFFENQEFYISKSIIFFEKEDSPFHLTINLDREDPPSNEGFPHFHDD